MDSARHHIARLCWQATAPDPAQALALRRLLRERSDGLPATLQWVFDASVPADEVWRLPTLRLRVRAADLSALAADFDATILQALRQALAELPRPPRDSAIDRPAEAAEATSQRLSLHLSAAVDFWHYLDTGLAPTAWANADVAALDRALRASATREAQAASADPARLAALQARVPLPRRLGPLLRWLALLPPGMRRRWVDAHRPVPPWTPALAVHARSDDAAIEAQALWLAWPGEDAPAPGVDEHRAVRRWLKGSRLMPAAVQHALRDAWAEASVRRTHTRPLDDERPPSPLDEPSATPESRPSTDAAIAVPLAGLVLLHPFLPRLLGGCKLLSADGRHLPDASLPRACALLHALACGDEPVAEHQLPLIKLLLGRSPMQPLHDALPALRPADQEEIDALLAAVRDHWPALRGSPSQTLRVSFLQRRGLLDRQDGGWRLRMQTEAFDLLLGLLPWSIGLVRLPWMPEPLGVEWPTP